MDIGKEIADKTAKKIMKSYISSHPNKVYEQDIEFVAGHIQFAIDKAIEADRDEIGFYKLVHKSAHFKDQIRIKDTDAPALTIARKDLIDALIVSKNVIRK